MFLSISNLKLLLAFAIEEGIDRLHFLQMFFSSFSKAPEKTQPSNPFLVTILKKGALIVLLFIIPSTLLSETSPFQETISLELNFPSSFESN